MSMQNYAKFESRVVEDSVVSSPNSYDYNQTSYVGSSYDYSYGFMDRLGNFFDGFLSLIGILLVVSLVLYFFYTIISLIGKGARETLGDIQNQFSFIWSKIFQGLKFIFTKIKNFFVYLRSHKKLLIGIIIAICLVNFAGNILRNTSKIVKVEKIQNGYVGVDLRNEKLIEPGYYAYLPYFSEFFLSRTSLFDFEIVSATANTKEDMFVELDYRVSFKLEKEKLIEFYQKFGAKSSENIASDIVMPRILEVLKGIIKQYSFKEISSKHNEIKLKTINETNKVLETIGIIMDDINVLDIRLPESYTKSIEDLEKADNELKLAEAQLEIQKKESEKLILKAENDAKVKTIEAEGVAQYNKTINANPISNSTLELKRIESKTEIEKLKIEKWNGVLPNTIESKNYIEPMTMESEK